MTLILCHLHLIISNRWPLLLGLLPAPWASIKLSYFIVYLPLLIEMIYRRIKLMKYTIFGMVLGAIWILGANYMLYRDIWYFPLVGYGNSNELSRFSFRFDGIVGILLDPRAGLLLFSPFLLYALGSMKQLALYVTDRWLPYRAFPWLFVAALLVTGLWPVWLGGYSYGHRLLLLFVPILFLGLAYDMEQQPVRYTGWFPLVAVLLLAWTNVYAALMPSMLVIS